MAARRGDLTLVIGADAGNFARAVGETLNQFGKQSAAAAGRAQIFGRALEALTDQGSSTARVLGSVLGGFAAGGVVGLAIGGLNALVGMFREMNEEQARALTKSQAWGDELNRQIQRNRDDLFVLWAEMEGGDIAAAAARGSLAVRDAKAKEAEAAAELLRIEREVGKAREAQSLDTWRAAEDIPIEVALLQQLEQAQKNAAAAAQYRADVEAAVTVRVGKVRRTEAEKRSTEAARASAEGDRLAAEAHIWAYEEQKAAEDAIEAVTEAEERAREEEHDAQEQANLDRLEMEQWSVDERTRIAEEAAREYEQALRPVGDAFADVFQGILLEGQNATEAMKGFATSMASYLLRTLVQMGVERVAAALGAHAAERQVKIADVVSAAGVAGAEGAAAVAGIPILGPAMAAAVAASLPVDIMGKTLPFASARGGWETPSIGSWFPAILHPKETVIPAWGKKALQNMAEVEPGGGAVVNHFYYSIDMDSFARHVRDAQRTNARDRRRP